MVTQVTPMPLPSPSRSMDQDAFDIAMEARMNAEPLYTQQFNQAVRETNDNAIAAAVAASSAASVLAATLTAKGSAEAAAASAIASPGTNGTSLTSLTLGAGIQSFTAQPGKNWAPGMWVNVARTSDATKSMSGPILSYNFDTGATQVFVATANVSGSGTFTDWTITISGRPGSILNLVDLSLVGPSSLPSLLADFANAKRLPAGSVYAMSSPQTYFDAMCVLRTAPPGVPAFDHDPMTGESLGIQMFEARTNLTKYSEEIENPAWTKVGVTVVPNNTRSPDGSVTMDRLVEDNSTGIHAILQDHGVQPIGTYTYSCFIKPFGRTQILLSQTISVSYAVVFDLISLTATSYFGGATGNIVRLQDNIYRLDFTFTTVSSHRLALVTYGAISNNPSYTGDGVSGFYAWGAQLEAGPFVTPYIPTTSTTVTRTAPQLYINTDTTWFNALEGALYVAASNTPPGALRTLASLWGGGGDVMYISGAINAVINTSGAQQFFVAGAPLERNKAVLSYKVNDSTASINGALAVTDTSVVPSPVTKLCVGSLDGSWLACGRISKLAYWPKRLSNNELSALTAQ